MPVTDRTLRLALELRIQLDAEVDAATRDLVAAWARTWQDLTREWARAIEPLMQAAADGHPPTRLEALRAARVQEALAKTRRAIADLSRYAGVRILQPLDTIVAQAAAGQTSLIVSQMPDNAAALDLRASVTRVDQDQLEAIVARTTQQVTSLAAAMTPAATQVLNAELVRGLALGLNPRKVAASAVRSSALLNRLEGGFLLPLNRAMNIARTEMLDAGRLAAEAQHNRNADVLGEWMWLATLEKRTCPSCWSKHGTTYPLSTPGPLDHQQGRCARMPVVKTWRELGFDIPEPPSVVPDAQTVFNDLPRADQLAIMGPSRLEAYEAGELDWTGMSTRRRTSGWRDSYGVTPVRAQRRRRLAA